MTLRTLFRSAIPAAFAAMAGSYVQAAPLPGGAGSLVETYQDWVVACQAQSDVPQCVMRQVQNNQSGQHLLTAEFRSTEDGRLEGALLMPFGLALSNGVSLKIDEVMAGPLPFSTCLPTGCLLPVDLDGDLTGKLRAGSVLDVEASAANAAQPVAFKISLNGFSAALNRISELTK